MLLVQENNKDNPDVKTSFFSFSTSFLLGLIAHQTNNNNNVHRFGAIPLFSL